jgi:YjbE family integral membrane protein
VHARVIVLQAVSGLAPGVLSLMLSATLLDPSLWVSLAKIIGVNLLLSGDNAVVIALACRGLPVARRNQGILIGTAGAVVLRIILTFFALYLLSLPYLKLLGALLLLWIGVRLLIPEKAGGGHVGLNTSLGSAIGTIVLADLVMSLDNVLGVAAAANGSFPLIVIGLLISIPMIVFGSQFIIKLMDRFPALITLGAGLLGYVAGEMGVTDPVWAAWVTQRAAFLQHLAPVLCAVLVVVLGTWLARRRRATSPARPLIDLAPETERAVDPNSVRRP